MARIKREWPADTEAIYQEIADEDSDLCEKMRVHMVETWPREPSEEAMNDDSVILAHRHSIRHVQEIEASSVCGCFYCLAIFPPRKIELWLIQEGTAFCPFCSKDSVIGSESGYPITPEFLQKMREHWFSEDRLEYVDRCRQIDDR